MYVIGDLNEWTGDRAEEDITGEFVAQSENENEKKVVCFCIVRGLSVNKSISSTSIYKSTLRELEVEME